METVFVFSKEGKIKVLGLEKAKEQKVELLKNGWEHTATIDPCVWIEYLFNQSEDVDIVAEVRELSIPVF